MSAVLRFGAASLIAATALLLSLAPAALGQLNFESAARFDLAAGRGPFSTALGDLNGDGALDVATANVTSDSVSLLLGTGTGALSTAQNVGLSGAQGANSIAIGDLNGDGLPDLVVANFVTGDVSVLLGTRGGGLASAQSYGLGGGRGPTSIALGDLTGDGTLDLVSANEDSNDVSVLVGTGSGSFASAQIFGLSGGEEPKSVALGDLNGDGALDLATANASSDDVSVLLGTGTGGFVAARSGKLRLRARRPNAVALGDLNGDGALDLVTANESDNVSVAVGTPAGLTAPRNFRLRSARGPSSVALGDLNADARPDLVTSNVGSGNVSVLLGAGGGRFTRSLSFGLNGGRGAFTVALGDLNADQAPDLVTANEDSNDVSVLLNAGARPVPRCGGRRPTLLGGEGGDTISGIAGRDVMAGLGGRDTILGRDDGDLLCGGPGDDRLWGDHESDRRFRRSGDARIPLRPGDDSLFGGPGDDRLRGGRGADRLVAGSGSDRIRARDGVRDLVDCGPGRGDLAAVDRLDRLRGCERVRRG